MKTIILFFLHRIARAVIRKHKPFVVGITGTVGKSTTSHFIFDAMEVFFGREKVFISLHNYNGEFGLPLTILRSASPHGNPFGWAWVFMKGIYTLFSSRYPECLVLEYGIDHPGEMDALLNIVEPDVAVILAISRNHVENFPNYDAYVAEKLKIIPRSKRVIYNADDVKITRELLDHPRDEVYSFGRKTAENVDFRARDVHSTLEGVSFDIQTALDTVAIKVPVVGAHQADNILPVFALAVILGKDVHEMTDIFAHLHPQKGRGSLLQGVNDTTILDGSYNGSFEAICAGIEYLEGLGEDFQRFLLLGDMRELGNESEGLHTELAEKIAKSQPHFVILVGEEMRKYTLPVLKELLPSEKIFHFLNARLAGQKMRELLCETEGKKVLFVKGSQNTIFLEEAIKEFLYDMRDTDNLCRQSPRWLKKKADFFDLVAPS